MQTGGGFFRPVSRPARDFGVLLARSLAAQRSLRVLDLMAGCGIRALRYGLEGGAASVWANDADPDRRALLEANLGALGASVQRRCTAQTAQRLLAELALSHDRHSFVDLDAFGCPTALLPAALEAVCLGGILYLASTDGRSATGHDRGAAVRRFGAAVRAHPASWELALRLQIGAVARAAWALGRGVRPLLSFSEGRTFRTALRLERLPAVGEEGLLGLIAHCHGCGDQQVQSLRCLGRWRTCRCGPDAPLAVSGPLWVGPLQDPASLEGMAVEAARSPVSLAPEGHRLLERLRRDPGREARCWPTALIGRQLGCGPPPLEALVKALRAAGHQADASGVMAGQIRSDAPWSALLTIATSLGSGASRNERRGDPPAAAGPWP